MGETYVNPVWNIFEQQIEDDSIHSASWVRFASVDGLDVTNTQLAVYRITTRDLDSYLDLSKAYLDVVYSYVGPGGAAIAADRMTMHTNAMTIWRKVTLFLNSVEVATSELPEVSSSIRNLLEYSDDYLNKVGPSQGFYYKNSGAVGAANNLARAALINQSVRARVQIPLSRIFKFCDDGVTSALRGLEIKLELEPQTSIAYSLWGGTAGAVPNDTTLRINELSLWIPKYTPSPTAERFYLESVAEGRDTRIVYEDWTTYMSTPFAAAVLNANYQVQSSSRKPKYIFAGIKLASRWTDLTNAETDDPSRWDTHGVTSITLKINGRNYPHERYAINYAASTAAVAQNYIRPYNDFLRVLDKDSEYDNGSLISYADYANTYAIYAFDLSQDHSIFENIVNQNYIEFIVNRTAVAGNYIIVATIAWERELIFKGNKNEITIVRP